MVSLDVPAQRRVFGDLPHLRQDEAVSEGVFVQRAPPLRCQDAVNKLETEIEAVVIVLVEPEGHTGGQLLQGMGGACSEAEFVFPPRCHMTKEAL